MVLQVVVLHQFAHDVEELIKADLIVFILICLPKQLGNVVRLLPTLSDRQAEVSDPLSQWEKD